MNTERNRIFKNREDAGRILAEKILRMNPGRSVVFALPRGGVPVGFPVARALDMPLDTVVSRKLGAPGNAEFGFGALAPGDVVILNDDSIESLGLSQHQIDDVLAQERVELDRRMVHYKSGEFSKGHEYEAAIIVDDGLATGITARAAIMSVRLLQKPKKIVFAAPVCSDEAVRAIESEVDDIVCLSIPDYFLAVGQWYERFNQVSDDEVIYLLHSMNDSRTLGNRQGA